MAFLVALAGLQAAPASAALTSSALDSTTGSPVETVVMLLKEMTKEVEAGGEEDKVSYDKYMCWCETTIKELEGNVGEATSKIARLEAYLVKQAGLMAEFKVKLSVLQKEEEPSDRDALETATEQRGKEKEAFDKEATDLAAAIAALKEAIVILSKVNLLQKQGASAAKISAEVRPALLQLTHLTQREGSPFDRFRSTIQKDLFDALNALNVEGKRQKGSFLGVDEALLPWEKTEEQKGMDAKLNDLEGAAAGAKSYNSRSGQILGMLKAMLDGMLTDLAQAQKAELEALIAFNKLKAQKSDEVKIDVAGIKEYEYKISTCTSGISDARTDLDGTKEALSADEKLLAETKKMCAQAEEEYKVRVAARNEELRAIAETIKILTGDEARTLFESTLSFVQIDLVRTATLSRKRMVQAAISRIMSVAKKHHSLALLALAMSTNLDAFTEVKAKIDALLAELQAQQKEEYEKHEKCKKDIDTTEDSIKEAEWQKKNLEATKLELENTIETLTNDITSLKDAIAAAEQALKKAGEERKAENQVFQKAVSDQRATAAILKKAQARMAKFYNAKAPELLQHGVAPPPEKTFAGKHQKSGGAGGVQQMLAKIISDAEQTEAELVVDEQHDQEAYATYAAETTAAIESDRQLVADKEEAMAKAKAELSETEEKLLFKETELEKYNDLLMNLHAECDYLIKYFSVRQSARAEEMETIKEAKAILSGAV